MNSRIFNKTATLYHNEGEVNGVAQYSVTYLKNVYYTEEVGTVASETAPADLLTLYYFDSKSHAESPDGKLKTYVYTGEYNHAQDRSHIFVMAEGDIIVPGIHPETDKPLAIEGAKKIFSKYRYKAGQYRMWHRKLIAR